MYLVFMTLLTPWVMQSIGQMRLSLDEQMMQSLSAQVVSIDFTPSLATLVMPVDGVKYESLLVGHVAATW